MWYACGSSDSAGSYAKLVVQPIVRNTKLVFLHAVERHSSKTHLNRKIVTTITPFTETQSTMALNRKMDYSREISRIYDESNRADRVKQRMGLHLVADAMEYFVSLEEFKTLLADIPDRSLITRGRRAFVQYWSEQITPRDKRAEILEEIAEHRQTANQDLDACLTTLISEHSWPSADLPAETKVNEAIRSSQKLLDKLRYLENHETRKLYALAQINELTAELPRVEAKVRENVIQANSVAERLVRILQGIEQAIRFFPSAKDFEESELFDVYNAYFYTHAITPPGCLKTLVREMRDPTITRFAIDKREPKLCRTVDKHPYKPKSTKPKEISV